MSAILTPPASYSDKPRPVLSKADFQRRYKAGEFGNHSPTWDSLEEWLDDRGWRYGNLFHIRNRIAGGQTWYDVPSTVVPYLWKDAINTGLRPNQLYLSAMAPTEKTVFQGEVQLGVWGYDLTYSTVVATMREALSRDARYANGVTALALLHRFLCPNSFEWLMHLLDAYPDHVVEFSTYSCEWGTVPGFNTVWWEVRRY